MCPLWNPRLESFSWTAMLKSFWPLFCLSMKYGRGVDGAWPSEKKWESVPSPPTSLHLGWLTSSHPSACKLYFYIPSFSIWKFAICKSLTDTDHWKILIQRDSLWYAWVISLSIYPGLKYCMAPLYKYLNHQQVDQSPTKTVGFKIRRQPWEYALHGMKHAWHMISKAGR